MAPPVPIIGIDPHKRSHTAVVLDDCEEVIAELRIDASHGQVDQLLAWAPPDPRRVWAVENANGLGYLLARQLTGRGEAVVDVPATLAARARKLSGKSGTKSDAHDARSVAIAAAHHRSLRQVAPEDLTTVIGCWSVAGSWSPSGSGPSASSTRPSPTSPRPGRRST